LVNAALQINLSSYVVCEFSCFAEDEAIAQLIGGSGTAPPPPPTDRELLDRGMGFPVQRLGGSTGDLTVSSHSPVVSPPTSPPTSPSASPERVQHRHTVWVPAVAPPAIVAQELGQHMQALRSSAASTPQRNEPGYTPPTPPSEVMVAVALRKAAEGRKLGSSQVSAAAAAAVAASAELQQQQQQHQRHTQSQQHAGFTSSSQRPKGLPPLSGAGGNGGGSHPFAAGRSLLNGDSEEEAAYGEFDQLAPVPGGSGIPGLVSPAVAPGTRKSHHQRMHSSGSVGSLSSAASGGVSSAPPASLPNGYSIGAQLPRGATWRYVDVLGNATAKQN
jgi:hypothetical protein